MSSMECSGLSSEHPPPGTPPTKPSPFAAPLQLVPLSPFPPDNLLSIPPRCLIYMSLACRQALLYSAKQSPTRRNDVSSPPLPTKLFTPSHLSWSFGRRLLPTWRGPRELYHRFLRRAEFLETQLGYVLMLVALGTLLLIVRNNSLTLPAGGETSGVGIFFSNPSQPVEVSLATEGASGCPYALLEKNSRMPLFPLMMREQSSHIRARDFTPETRNS